MMIRIKVCYTLVNTDKYVCDTLLDNKDTNKYVCDTLLDDDDIDQGV